MTLSRTERAGVPGFSADWRSSDYIFVQASAPLPAHWAIVDGVIVSLPPSNPHKPFSNAKWHPPRPRAPQERA